MAKTVSGSSNNVVSNITTVSSIQQIPKHDVVKLCDATFLLWKQQVSLIVDGYGLLDFLSDDFVLPSRLIQNDAGQHVSNPEFLPSNRQDKLLAFWLLTTVSAEVLPLLVSCNTSRSVWSTIIRLFAAKSATKVSSLRHSLHTQKKCGLPVSAYLAKIRMLCDSLSAAGSVISEQEQVNVILAGLSMEFESVIAVASRELMSLEKLTEMLLDCEARQHMFLQENLPAHANLAIQQAHHGSVGTVSVNSHPPDLQQVSQSYIQPSTYQNFQSYGRGRRGSFYNRNRGRGRQGNNTNRPQCQLCGRIGHTVHECWYRFDHEYSGENGRDNQDGFYQPSTSNVSSGVHSSNCESSVQTYNQNVCSPTPVSCSAPVQQRCFVSDTYGVSTSVPVQSIQGSTGYSVPLDVSSTGPSSSTVPMSFAARCY